MSNKTLQKIFEWKKLSIDLSNQSFPLWRKTKCGILYVLYFHNESQILDWFYYFCFCFQKFQFKTSDQNSKSSIQISWKIFKDPLFSSRLKKSSREFVHKSITLERFKPYFPSQIRLFQNRRSTSPKSFFLHFTVSRSNFKVFYFFPKRNLFLFLTFIWILKFYWKFEF